MAARTDEKYTYVMHITEVVESQVTIKSRSKLTYEQLERKAEKARVSGETVSLGVSDVRISVDDAKPGGSDAVARPR